MAEEYSPLGQVGKLAFGVSGFLTVASADRDLKECRPPRGLKSHCLCFQVVRGSENSEWNSSTWVAQVPPTKPAPNRISLGAACLLHKMAPQVGLEPTTLRLTGEIQPLRPTTPTNQTQRNNKKSLRDTVSRWPLSVALNGQKADRVEHQERNARCKAGVSQLAESANIQHRRPSCWRLLRGTAYPNKQRPADLKCTREKRAG
jgi:hypothetical protein